MKAPSKRDDIPPQKNRGYGRSSWTTLSLFCFGIAATGCHNLYKKTGPDSNSQEIGSPDTGAPPLGRSLVDSRLNRRESLLEELKKDEKILNLEPSMEPEEITPAEKVQRPADLLRPYFDWPVDQARFTRGFSSDPVKAPRSRRKRPHLGIDLAAPMGSPIYASHSGTVIYVGKDFKGYGKLIVIEDANAWASLYAHLSRAFVREGQKVAQGEKIGRMGKTGRAFGVHLHFELRTLQGPVDPLEYLPRSVLQMQETSSL